MAGAHPITNLYSNACGGVIGNWIEKPGAQNKRQEAFNIHLRHTTFYLYYCKFTSEYLTAVVQHGVDAGNHIPSRQKLKLERTRGYDFRKAADRGEFTE